MDIEQHVDTLLRLLDIERAAEVERFGQEQASRTLDERAALGHVVLDLRAADTRSLAGRVVLEFVPTAAGREVPSSEIGVGSIVRALRRPPATSDEEASGVVSRLTRTSMSVAFDAPPPDWVDEGRVGFELLPNAVTYERQRAGLLRLRAQGDTLRRWRELLIGDRAPAFEEGPFEPNLALNDEQNAAVRLAMRARDLALVHGPPGTGKTTVLAEIVARAVERGERVLIAAGSNLAVDNLLERVAVPGRRVVRLGHVARVTERLLPWTLDEQIEADDARAVARDLLDEAHALLARARKQATRGRSADRFAEAREARAQAGRLFKEAREMLRAVRSRIVSRAEIVCATCTGTESDLLDRESFDLAVIDEATQATEPATLLPLLRAKRAVLAGDPLQLPPTVISPEAARAGLAQSLFERLVALHGASIGHMLREQYRMHERIMSYPSAALYGGALRAHPSVAQHLLTGLGIPESEPLASAPIVFLDTAGKGFDDEAAEPSESRRNPGEAELVAQQVRRLIDAGLAPSAISVIAPYEAQVQTLRALLPVAGLEIDTVDGFQGQENEAVVVSLTRSNANAEVGFLSDVRRMNVAITRARRLLLVVGDSATISAHPFYRAFVEYVTEVGGYRSAWESG